MRQALHIFRKDVRHLWIEIAAVLLATGLFTFTDAGSAWRSPMPRNMASLLVTFLLPFAWWTLIVRGVHAEPLTGDRQFWPTRPYSWRSLLAAKALLVLTVVNLPLLIAQTIVVKAHGFSLAAEVPGLLWTQVLLTAAFLLPVAAVAAITASVMQFLVIGLVAWGGMLLLSLRFLVFASALSGGFWGPIEWIRSYYALLLAAIAASGVLVWQYARRRTWAVRTLAIAAAIVIALGAPFSWSTGFRLQSRLSRRPAKEFPLRARFHPKFQWAARTRVRQDGRVSVHIPLEVTGAPDDVLVKTEGLIATIEAPGGARWRADAEPRTNVSSTGQLIALQTIVDGAFYRKVKDQPVRIRGNLYVTLYGNRRVSKLPFSDRPAAVPGLGICSASAGTGAPYFLTCNSMFRQPPDLVTVQFETLQNDRLNYTPRHEISYSPFPADFGIDPVIPYVTFSTYRGPLDAVTIVALEPLAHVEAPLAIDGLRLADFEGTAK